ncbi:MAG: Sec-independent protein translocase subunit TatA/TatB [Planctomycetota bacterium]
MIAFIGTSELILAAFVGLLLFGGRLPQVMREAGKVWFGLRRSLNELKRETGFDEAVRDIKRETDDLAREANDFRVSPYDWKKDLDPFAGPGKDEPVADAKTEPAEASEASAGTDPDVESAEKAPPKRKTPPQAVSRDDVPPKFEPSVEEDEDDGSGDKA